MSLVKNFITSSSGRDFQVTRTHYFNKLGSVKYTELVTEYSNYVDSILFPVEYKMYEKIVNEKVIETKLDSVIYIGE